MTSLKYIKNRKLVYGVGISDSDYAIRPTINGKQAICPYYRAWSNMLERCYSAKYQAKRPTYIECTVAPEWHRFMAFRSWMIGQEWQGKQLDKDILVPGNKIYGSVFCVFVSSQVNKLLTDHAAARGLHPQGVCWHKQNGNFRAQIRIFGKRKHLGYFITAESASAVYRKAKHDYICWLLNPKQTSESSRAYLGTLHHLK